MEAKPPPLEGWMIVALVTILCSIAVIVSKFLRQEKKREQSFKLFLKEASKEFGTVEIPAAIISSHEKLREHLYDRFFKGNDGEHKFAGESWPASVDEADARTEAEGLCSVSWQRLLNPEAKSQLKKVLLRRAISTLPRYQALYSEFMSKGRLFERQLIADSHWCKVKSAFEETYAQIQRIGFEANCLEEDWGTRPEGFFRIAQMVLKHEEFKQEQEEAAKRAQREEEKEKLKKAKMKEHADRVEQAKLEKQKRQAEKMMQHLIREEDEKRKKGRAT